MNHSKALETELDMQYSRSCAPYNLENFHPKYYIKLTPLSE